MVEWPRIEDQDAKMVALLTQIAANTGGLKDLDQSTDVTIENQGVGSRVGTIEPRDMIVVETENLDSSEPDGTMEIKPGETETFLQFRGQPHGMLAVGATDKTDTDYLLRSDSSVPIGGTTESPLGAINDPFSFVDTLGGAPHAEDSTTYRAHLDPSASSPVYVAGRLFLEVLA
jgi:hypothetical protein